ncbi:hypothetical protein SAMN05518849_12354 [Sphingobium sp. AP50]|nr:hypothetical protein SAMN05518849_12354 [Sphingobium sp. AP50]
MANAHMLSIDLAKRSFQVCATDRAVSVLYNRTISRSKLEALLREQPRSIVAMEACATKMDRAQRRSPRQLVGTHDGSQDQDGGCRRTGK